MNRIQMRAVFFGRPEKSALDYDKRNLVHKYPVSTTIESPNEKVMRPQSSTSRDILATCGCALIRYNSRMSTELVPLKNYTSI